MPIYRITRPEISQRRFAFGFELKPGQSLYVDHLKVAAAFNSTSWTATEVDKVDNGSSVIKCMENDNLRSIIESKEVHFANKPKGKWLIEKPSQWSRVFVFGFDTRKPFEVEDYDLVEKFQAMGFKISTIQEEGPTIQEIAETIAAVENPTSSIGAPMTTYSTAKRGPGRPKKVHAEV